MIAQDVLWSILWFLKNAFSKNYCTIDEIRSHLSHNTLEVLLCLADRYIQEDMIDELNIDNESNVVSVQSDEKDETYDNETNIVLIY